MTRPTRRIFWTRCSRSAVNPSPSLKQDDYLADLLAHANNNDAEFVTWFVLQDYDALCNFIGGCSDTDVLWQDSGLYDGFGNIRPAYTRWTNELAK